jgi:hypothetical protein
VCNEILKYDKLFVTFTFNPVVYESDKDKSDKVKENQIITRNKTFYGVYDFLPVVWTKTEEHPQTYYANDSPNFIEPSEEDKTEICQAMQQFMAHVKKSDKGGGGGADTIMIDDPDYLKKGGIRDNYTYTRNSQITKEI